MVCSYTRRVCSLGVKDSPLKFSAYRTVSRTLSLLRQRCKQWHSFLGEKGNFWVFLSLGLTQITYNSEKQCCQLIAEWEQFIMVAHLYGVTLVSGLLCIRTQRSSNSFLSFFIQLSHVSEVLVLSSLSFNGGKHLSSASRAMKTFRSNDYLNISSSCFGKLIKSPEERILSSFEVGSQRILKYLTPSSALGDSRSRKLCISASPTSLFFYAWPRFPAFKHCTIQPVVNQLLIREPRSWHIRKWWNFHRDCTFIGPLICWFSAVLLTDSWMDMLPNEQHKWNPKTKSVSSWCDPTKWTKTKQKPGTSESGCTRNKRRMECYRWQPKEGDFHSVISWQL